MRGMLRTLVIVAFLGAGATYIAAPFWAAWSIREAVKTGDVATLKDKIVWERVRSSLRQSIAVHAELLPAAIDVGRQVKPTLWQRVRSMFGASMLDRFMDRYITAEGLPKLYQLKNGYRTRVQGLPDERTLPLKERFTRLIRRVRRAEFKSFDVVEIEIEDKDDADRQIVATLEIVGLGWKLTSLTVKSEPFEPQPVARIQKAGFSFGIGRVPQASDDEEARQYADDVRNNRLVAPEKLKGVRIPM